MTGIKKLTLTASGRDFTALEAGSSDTSLVLCLHGFPDSPATFRHQFDALAAAGHRVVAPTLRGYEPSSQPSDGDFSLVALADDVIGWLDHLEVERAHLVGHDWGAAITYAAAARNPDRCLTATALAIPPLPRIPKAVRRLPRQLQRSWYMTFFQLRGVSERALTAKDWWLLRRLWRTWSPAYTMSGDEWRELRAQLDEPGVLGSALAYYRQNATPPILLGLRSTPAMKLAKVPVPTLIMHGTDDGCMDRKLFDRTIHAEDYPAGVQRLELDGAGHFLHLEQPEEVNAALIEHLSQ